MALREFTDRSGRAWRVWDVSPETLHPSTRAEDYMRDYLTGWLAFESLDGRAKCRFTPVPKDWHMATAEELDEWLHAAEPVRGERTSGPHGRTEAEEIAQASELDVRKRPQSRTFRFPGGRFWTVAEWTSPDPRGTGAGAMRHVLRFNSGSRVLELTNWPGDWASMSDEELSELLSRGFPRDAAKENPTEHHRRSADPEAR
ncbi:MAG TPA: hypothetical protein VF761_01975 [Gemmatimonadaceae bacterium]